MQPGRLRPLLWVAIASCSPEVRTPAPQTPSPVPIAEGIPWHEAIYMVGRHRRLESGQIRYGWPATGFIVRFEGTTLDVRLDDQAQHHQVFVDGEEAGRLDTTLGEHRYTVVGGLPRGEHEVMMLRRTEGHLGPTTLLEVEVDGPLVPVPEPAIRIEVIGDSITAGYGNEGDSRDCKYSPGTQNALASYIGIAAREVGAELSAVAWSGKGVVFNYGGDRTEPMPMIYERSVPTEADSRWEFPTSADVVVVNLGTNDFSTDNDPSAEEFVASYTALLARVREAHPAARILTTVAPMLGDDERQVVQVYVEQAITGRLEAGDSRIRWIDLQVHPRGYGCDWHPSGKTHELMAQRLESELRRALR